MKEIQKFAVGMAGILLLGAIDQASAAINITSFTSGPLANGGVGGSTWVTTDTASPPSSVPSPTSTSFTYVGSSVSTGGYISILSITTPAGPSDYNLNVNLTLYGFGTTGSAQAYWEVSDTADENGTDYSDNYSDPLTAENGGFQSQLADIDIPAGTTLNFEIDGVGPAGSGGPASLDVSISPASVPESGGWLAGIFLVGVVGVAAVRQKTVGPIQKKS